MQPVALFDENGDMRKTSKVALKHKIQIMLGVHNQEPPSVVILDSYAILWTIPWPTAPAKISDIISAAVKTILRRVKLTSILNL